MDGQQFDVPDDATTAEIDSLTQPAKAARRGPSPGVPNVLDLLQRGSEWAGAKHEEATRGSPNLAMFTNLMGMGAMRAIPGASPTPTLNRIQPQPEAPPPADPVTEQIDRIRRLAGPRAGDAPTSPLPELPKMLDWVLPGKATKIYDILRKATTPNAAPPPPEAPLPGGGGEGWRMPAPLSVRAPGPPPAPPPTSEIATSPAPMPEAPPPAPLPPAPPPAPASVANIFEKAARGRKVSELVKAIDANASAHLGVDPMDPRFGEALGSLPQEWWEGMGSVAKINKPSPDTIAEVLAFYKDRSGQTAQKIAP